MSGEAKRKRGVNTLNADLRQEFPFLKTTKSDSDVRCTICNVEFDISHSGKGNITSHMNSDRHKKALSAAASSQPLSKFFKSSTMTKEDIDIAAREGVWCYHIVNSNHSFRSSDCSSQIIRSCFGMPKFSCARTKCVSIVTNVFAPYVVDQLKTELADTQFVTVITDASNHGSVKLFPVVVRYFSEKEGVKVRILDLTSQEGEKSDIIVSMLQTAIEKFGIKEKLAGFCGDNAPCNFGNRERTGTDNVYYKLNQIYPGLIGIGCGAHIIHNTLKAACDQMPFDVEVIVVKIYSHFYIFTVRVAKLKEFCDSVGTEYKRLLGYSKTRFLALLSAVESILRIFDGLKEYFLEDKSSPKALKEFFMDPMSKIWLLFLRDQVSVRFGRHYLFG